MTANTTTDSTTRVEDLYPSRVKQQPEFLERRDPVVDGDAQNGPLNAEQLEQFDRDGFLLLPGFYTNQQVSLCHQELDRLRDSEQIRQRPEAIVEPDGSALRSLFAVHRPEISTRFSQVAADKRILEMVMQVLGSEVYIHQSRVNLKPGFAGKEFFWHSDFETWHVEDGLPRMRTVSCSLLLDDNHEFNAPLMLLPGSHRQYVTCVGQAPENHYQSSLKQQKYGVPDPESLTQLVQEYGITQAAGPAGSLLLFDCNTMHGSNGNITPYPRSNLFFVYNSIWNQLANPFCNQKPRPEFIASREFSNTMKPREFI